MRRRPEKTGRAIVVGSWVGDAIFAVTAIPAAAGVDAFDGIAVGTALGLFFFSLPVWTWAFVLAASRSARGDDIVVGNMFGNLGDAPRDVRLQLWGSLAACIVVAIATAAADPFGVLVPMLPLGLLGLWAARHGTYPPRAASRPRPGRA